MKLELVTDTRITPSVESMGFADGARFVIHDDQNPHGAYFLSIPPCGSPTFAFNHCGDEGGKMDLHRAIFFRDALNNALDSLEGKATDQQIFV